LPARGRTGTAQAPTVASLHRDSLQPQFASRYLPRAPTTRRDSASGNPGLSRPGRERTTSCLGTWNVAPVLACHQEPATARTVFGSSLRLAHRRTTLGENLDPNEETASSHLRATRRFRPLRHCAVHCHRSTIAEVHRHSATGDASHRSRGSGAYLTATGRSRDTNYLPITPDSSSRANRNAGASLHARLRGRGSHRGLQSWTRRLPSSYPVPVSCLCACWRIAHHGRTVPGHCVLSGTCAHDSREQVLSL
jgi:hypothetical protein